MSDSPDLDEAEGHHSPSLSDVNLSDSVAGPDIADDDLKPLGVAFQFQEPTSSRCRTAGSEVELGGIARKSRLSGYSGGKADIQTLEEGKDLKTKVTQLTDLMATVNKQNERLAEELRARDEQLQEMKFALAEGEKFIKELIDEMEMSKKRFKQRESELAGERDEAVARYKKADVCLAGLTSKYSRAKEVLAGFQQNEEVLKRCLEDDQVLLKKEKDKYERLRIHAEETLDKANKEIENKEAELIKITAMMKKAEAKAHSLERSIEHHKKENQELTAICDELIAKVSFSN